MYSLRFILENPSVLDQYKLKQLLFYTLHYEQIPAVVNTDYLSCQFDKPGQWSSCVFFLFSGCSFIVFHKSLLCNCSLLLNFKAAFCIHVYISLQNQAHINQHATNLSFCLITAALSTWQLPPRLVTATESSVQLLSQLGYRHGQSLHQFFWKTREHSLAMTSTNIKQLL